MRRTTKIARKRRQTQAGSLSREKPTPDEVRALLDAMINAPPIATAVMGASFVEYHLEDLIRDRIPRNDDITWKELTNEKGPLGTLSMKIALGHALRLYGDDLRDNLDIMRAIRNAFAHTKKLIDFDNPKVVRELRSVTGRPLKRYGKYKTLKPDEARSSYIGLCLSLAIDLLDVSSRAHKRANARWERKHITLKQIAQMLVPGAETPRGLLATALLKSGASQTLNPKPEAPGSNYLAHFLRAGKTDRNKGK